MSEVIKQRGRPGDPIQLDPFQEVVKIHWPTGANALGIVVELEVEEFTTDVTFTVEVVGVSMDTPAYSESFAFKGNAEAASVPVGDVPSRAWRDNLIWNYDYFNKDEIPEEGRGEVNARTNTYVLNLKEVARRLKVTNPAAKSAQVRLTISANLSFTPGQSYPESYGGVIQYLWDHAPDENGNTSTIVTVQSPSFSTFAEVTAWWEGEQGSYPLDPDWPSWNLPDDPYPVYNLIPIVPDGDPNGFDPDYDLRVWWTYTPAITEPDRWERLACGMTTTAYRKVKTLRSIAVDDDLYGHKTYLDPVNSKGEIDPTLAVDDIYGGGISDSDRQNSFTAWHVNFAIDLTTLAITNRDISNE